MFDVFYSGTKPNLFAHEQAVDTIEQAQQQSRTRFFWFVNYLCDYTGFDFLWEPAPWEANQRHAWPSQWQKDAGTYLVPAQGYAETNYRSNSILTRLPDRTCWTTPNTFADDSFDFSWHPDATESPYIYQFGTQHQRTDGPKYCMPGATEVKFVNSPRVEKISIDSHWELPAADVEDFDYTWHPDTTEPPYIYQFGTQHQRTGGPKYCMPGATDIKYVDQIKIKTRAVATAIYEIDHMDGNTGFIPNITRTVRYFDNYLDTLRRLVKSVPEEHEYVWICSSVCDYATFDFSWHPEVWQGTMLHVFASDSNKFGDTFFMHVPSFRHRMDQIELLDWYNLNFIETSVPRRPLPVIRHTNDSQVDSVKTASWLGPLAIFATHDRPIESIPCVPLWREKTKTVVPLDQSGSTVVVPKVSVAHIKDQMYDYKYIDKTKRKTYCDQPLDIVFISNGESAAEDTFMHLQNVASDLFIKQKVHRVDGVKGRVAAYHAAARSSTTPWFFAVFAKLFVNENFDWDWQPDRMQQAKHYIFHALNPVNGLEYGHQAMIAYNKQLVLNNPGHGLDFTLDDAHEVVPMLSGTAVYNMSPWVAWRTAFREALKLKMSLPDVENEYRLTQWLITNPGSQHIINEQWSRWGAEDAVEYFEQVSGNFAALKKSYEWDWLASYAFIKRNLTPDQQ